MKEIRREVQLRLTVWKGNKDAVDQVAKATTETVFTDIDSLTNGGELQWPQKFTLSGKVSEATDEPYTIDTLPIPFDNPYNSLMFLGGLDFLSNGDAYVCTFFGDVWRVSGINGDLKKVTWKRFATGLNQALGVAVRNDQVFVIGKDQITRLHDLNHDGEADYYENFCNSFPAPVGGHDFNTGLQVSDLGYFYFGTGHAGIIEVSPDGAVARSIATGIRNPDGIGVSPDGIVTCPPQEGQWTPCGLKV